MSIGIASVLLILLFVQHELSYDRWNENADRIVRPTLDINFGGNAQHYAVTVVTCPQCVSPGGNAGSPGTIAASATTAATSSKEREKGSKISKNPMSFIRTAVFLRYSHCPFWKGTAALV
ncbi:MAG: hypothetical protein R2788_02210 [Saprospiraceae bacterium]